MIFTNKNGMEVYNVDMFLKITPFIIVIISIFILILVICKMIKYIEALQFEIEKCKKKITRLEILYNIEKGVIESVSNTE